MNRGLATRPRPQPLALVLALLLTAVLAACGGADGNPATVTAQAPAPPVPAPPPASGPLSTGGCPSSAKLQPVVGVWQNITPDDFKTPSNMETWNVSVNPVDNAVYATAGNGTNGGGGTVAGPDTAGTGVYRSTDCGLSFNKVSTGTNARLLEKGSPFGLMSDPTNANVLYTSVGYGAPSHLFKSIDAGRNWVDLLDDAAFMSHFQYGGFVRAFTIDPRDARHLLVIFHESCFDGVLQSQGGWGKAGVVDPGLQWSCNEPDRDGNCTNPATRQACNGQCMDQGIACVAETLDAGSNWRLTKGAEPFVNADGGMIGFLPPATAGGPSAWVYGYPNGNLWYSGNAGASWNAQPLLQYAQTGGYMSSPYAASDGKLYLAAAGGVYVADPSVAPLGTAWTKIDNSPLSNSIVDDGSRFFVAWQFASGGGEWMNAAPLNSRSAWQKQALDSGMVRGGYLYADRQRHVIYSANGVSGLWRMFTQ